MKITLKLMEDASEIIQSYLPYVSIGIQKNKLSYFDGMKALCHWHNDIELVKIISGEMNYYINGKTIHLKENDGLVINSKAMHYGFSENNQDCEFICILIDPEILGTKSALYTNLIFPIINSSHIDCQLLDKENKKHSKIFLNIEELHRLYQNFLSTKENVDLECTAISCYFWKNWFDIVKSSLLNNNQENSIEIQTQKKMTRFIYQNYMHPIKLENIAESANICRSKCCILFKKYVQQSPINFLNEYRIERAKELIINTDKNITEVALLCGFNNLSYFSKQFFKITGKTPKKYKLEILATSIS
ncbi:TPA: AraC family transcriptional regulator [Mannheimia haemolytica]